ncbi:hypothetical protein, partial [Escherichia coli]|uniref:hypothetical protein n=1 Tax=Escherichia coli TaxID=562 RepID=UPI001A92F481
DRNRSHWSTSKTPSYTKSVSWQHHPSAYSHSSGGWARDYIFIYGGKFSFLCKSLNRYLSYISYSADSE